MRALALPACVRIFKYCQFKVHFIMEIPMSIDIPSITQVKFFDFLSGFFFARLHYSETSNKGHSERGQTFQQRTIKPKAHTL